MNKAQSTIEYLVISSVIIAAIIIGAITFLKPAVNESVDRFVNDISNEFSF